MSSFFNRKDKKLNFLFQSIVTLQLKRNYFKEVIIELNYMRIFRGVLSINEKQLENSLFRTIYFKYYKIVIENYLIPHTFS
jgi:hypothetical protein